MDYHARIIFVPGNRLFIIFIILVLVISAVVAALYFGKKDSLPEFIEKSPINFNREESEQKEENGDEPVQQSQITVSENLPEGVNAGTLKSTESGKVEASLVSISEGDFFTLAVEAKIGDPAAGQNYTVWLAENLSSGNLYKLGQLEKNEDVWGKAFTETGNFSKYKFAVITLETNDDGNAEKRLFEGELNN